MNKKSFSLWPGALAGLALVFALHSMSHAATPGAPNTRPPVAIGSEDTPPPPSQAEPDWRSGGWWDVVCTILGHLPDWCPRPIKEVEPIPPPVSSSTPACDINRPCGSEDACGTPYNQ